MPGEREGAFFEVLLAAVLRLAERSGEVFPSRKIMD
jgi:hypothetical protein